MSKIKLFFLLIIMFPISSKAQEQDNLPFYSPPSPNAYELGKYGQIPVGMFTGTPNFTLPLYEYKTTNLTIPISVSYSSNGIKVDQIESKVGLGWVLNAGGVITRIVRDLPDEEYLTFYPEEEIEELGAQGPLSATFFYEAGNSDYNDTETDLFMFNFLGKSGKFVVDNDKKIIQMPYSDLKIEPYYFTEEDNGYIITTCDGIKFYFSDIEITRSYTIPNNHPDPEFVKTSWYLSKIIHPFGDEVYFTYEHENLNYINSISQSVEVLSPTWQIDWCGNVILQTPIWHYYENHSVVNGLRLIEISSSVAENGKVQITPISPPSSIGTAGNSLVDEITILNKDLNDIEKFKFNYHYLSNSKRIFLDQIIFKDISKYYKFDYIDLASLCPRLSFEQDHWGYYNGASTNACFVPRVSDIAFSVFNFGADREPCWEYSKKGLLSKIQYPTKGTTELIYESNTYYGEKTVYPPKKECYLVTSSDEEGYGSGYAVSDDIYSSIDQQISITVNVEFNTSQCDPLNNDPGKSKATLYIIDKSTNQSVEFYTISQQGFKVPRGNLFTENPVISNCFADLSANTSYEVTLTPTFFCVKTWADFFYYDELPVTTEQNIETGGSRIEQIISHDPILDDDNIIRYYYGNYESLDISSGDRGQEAYYIGRQSKNDECAFSSGNTMPYLKTVKILSSSSLTPLFNTGNNNIYYRYVNVSLGGDNFENGGEEHIYTIHRDIRGRCLSYSGEEVLSAPWSNVGWDNGQEERSFIYKIGDNSSRINVKETIFSYEEDERKYEESKGYSVVKRYELLNPAPPVHICTEEDMTKSYSYHVCVNNNSLHHHVYFITGGDSYCISLSGGGANNQLITFDHPCKPFYPGYPLPLTYNIANLDIMEYKNIGFWTYLKSEETIQYDDDGLNPTSTIVNYFYDNPEHVQLTRIESTSSNGDLLRTTKKYPHDVESSSLMESLIEQHRIAEVVLEKKEVRPDENSNWQPVSTQDKIYKNWDNLLIQPEIFRSSIFGNLLEPTARFYNINSANGNPREFSKENDIHMALIWGYQETKPVVKGENVSYNDLNDAVDQTNPDLEQLLSPSGIGDLTSQTQRDAWKNFNETLRNQSVLQHALITTYTYKSLVGITSVTDPGGITTYYEYDENGRLWYVRDNDYSILKKYEYNYMEVN